MEKFLIATGKTIDLAIQAALDQLSMDRGFRRSQRDRRVGQPFAGHQPRLYAGLQRFERPVRQRIFPFPRQSRRRSDENADREDQIRRQINEIHRDALGHMDVDYTVVLRVALGRRNSKIIPMPPSRPSV